MSSAIIIDDNDHLDSELTSAGDKLVVVWNAQETNSYDEDTTFEDLSNKFKDVVFLKKYIENTDRATPSYEFYRSKENIFSTRVFEQLEAKIFYYITATDKEDPILNVEEEKEKATKLIDIDDQDVTEDNATFTDTIKSDEKNLDNLEKASPQLTRRMTPPHMLESESKPESKIFGTANEYVVNRTDNIDTDQSTTSNKNGRNIAPEYNSYEMQNMNGNGYTQTETHCDGQFTRPRHNIHSVSWRWPIIVLLGGCLLYYLVHLNDHILPTVITGYEAEQTPGLFSGERSKASLVRLTDLGPRVVGDDANEIKAPELIEEEVNEAKRTAHPSQSIKVERQKGSGSYQLRIVPPLTNVYENIQNVLVMVEGNDGNHGILVNCHFDTVPEVDGASDDGISCAVMLELIRVLAKMPKRLDHNVVFLFNGAEEAAVQGSHLFLQHPWANNTRIVLNLEAAGAGGRSILFQSGPKNSWLFNYYSKYAPHPHGLVMAEEMFQAGMIPSDTDFRIFRDFGKLPGLDFAFSRNGHVYHTIYDSEKYIPAGSHQHMGDNTLALLNSLGYAKELYNIKDYSEGQVVYYDYLGWFMISYSAGGAIALNIFMIALAVFSVVVFIGRLLRWSWLPESTPIAGKKFEKFTFDTLRSKFTRETKTTPDTNSPRPDYVHVDRQLEDDIRRRGTSVARNPSDVSKIESGDLNISMRPMKPIKRPEPVHELKTYMAVLIEIGIAVAARVAGMGAAIGVTAIIALIINSASTLAMPWFSNIWLLFPLYWCPCLIVSAIVPHFVEVWRSKKHKLSLSFSTQMHIIAAQIPFIFIYFIMTCSGSRSAAIFFIPILFATISNLVILLTPLYLTTHKWIWVYFAIHIPAILFNMYITLLGYVTFAPVMARSGVINGDLNIAIVTCILCILLTSFVLPLMNLVRKPGVVFALLTLFSIVMIIISLSSSVGHPYKAGPSEPKPQRYWIMHTLREYRNETGGIRLRESGYFVLNLDGNSPKTIPLRGRSNLRSLRDDCEHEQYCGLPLYLTRMVPLSPTSSWIPAGMPLQPELTELTLGSKVCDSVALTCNLTLLLRGPDRMTLTFAPRTDVELVKWSLPSEPDYSEIRQGRPSYFLHIVRGELQPYYNISLVFSVLPAMITNNSPILDIALAGNHVHHENQRTKEFQSLLDSLPVWTQRTGWISAFKSYVL